MHYFSNFIDGNYPWFKFYHSSSNNHGFKIKLTSSSPKVTLVHLNTQ